jgi:hypothetical protein
MTDEPEWRDMLVNGGKVSAEWQAEAWCMWVTNAGQPRMTSCLNRTGPKPGRDARSKDPWYLYDIADRMMQKARKAGLVEYRGKRWHLR